MKYNVKKIKDSKHNEFEIKEIETVKDIHGNNVEIYKRSERIDKNFIESEIQNHQKEIKFHENEINKLQEKLDLINSELNKDGIK